MGSIPASRTNEINGLVSKGTNPLAFADTACAHGHRSASTALNCAGVPAGIDQGPKWIGFICLARPVCLGLKPPCRASGKHPGRVLHALRHLAQVVHGVAELHLHHAEALEVVAANVFIGDGDAAVQLNALLTDEAH